MPEGKLNRRRILRVPRRRIVWKQEDWEEIAKKYAAIEIRYQQGGKNAPGFRAVFDEAMVAALAADKHRQIPHKGMCPKYFEVEVKKERDRLLSNPVSQVSQVSQPPAMPLADEPEPVSELEGVAALLQTNAENQERLEAKLEHQYSFMENLVTVIEAVLTSPSLNPEETLRQPAVVQALSAIEREEVIIAGVRPKYCDELERNYGKRFKLRLFPLGDTNRLANITGFEKTKYVISAYPLYHAGLKRVIEKTGLRLIELGNVREVKQTLNAILSKSITRKGV